MTGTGSKTVEPTTCAIDYIRAYVHRRSGIVLEPERDYLIRSRLRSLFEGTAFSDVDGLAEAVRGHPDGQLGARVIDAFTTNETLWFRDRAPFDALGESVLPEILERRGNPTTIWSAACSSGQEAYSIAMVLDECGVPRSAQRVVATDISKAMVERTRCGKYTAFEVSRGLPDRLLAKYFEKVGEVWRVSHRIRDVVDARVLNLLDSTPHPSNVDVVFLRNVLIYFDLETKRRVLESVIGRMRAGGFLFLGAAESIAGISKRLERFTVATAVCYRFDG